MTKKSHYLITLILFMSLSVFPQVDNPKKNDNSLNPYSTKNFNSWAISLGAGNIFTSGDLSSIGVDNSSFDIGLNASITKMFNSTLGIELQGITGTANAYPDKYKVNVKELNGASSTQYFTANLLFVLNLSNLIYSGNNYQRKWNFTIYPGIGTTFHKAYYTSNITWSNGETDPEFPDEDWANNGEKENSYTRLINIPFGLSLKYRLSKHFDIELRETITYYTEDNFDGRVFDTTTDWGYYTGISLVWKIGNKERSLEWGDPLDESFSRIDEIENKVQGMSADSDKDGVADLFDLDNKTPEGVMVAGNGRALDVDKDGIPDYKDVEPFTATGVSIDSYGKELDSDYDGVGDSKDIEPNSKKGAFVNWQGATISGSDLTDALIPSVYFKLNSSAIDYKMHRSLAVIAKLLTADTDLELIVIGYADKSGVSEYNQKLGLRRAKSVVEHLVEVYGIKKYKFSIKSLGDTSPLSNKNSYYSINRRVDFKVKK